MDATEATIRTSLHGNQQQLIAVIKTLQETPTPKRSDKSKMIQFANEQATMVAAQGKISEDLHLLRTLGFMSTNDVENFSKRLRNRIQELSNKKSN